MRKNIVFVAVAALLVSSTAAFAAPTLIHACIEDYFESGTRVIDSLNAQKSFDVGVIEGPRLWEVMEKAWWDEEKNQTIITYTVFNDSISDPIASLHITSSGLNPVSITNGTTGWTGFIGDDEYGWSTDDEAYGIATTQAKNEMTVVFDGLWRIGYVNVAYDLANGDIITNDNWVVSTAVVPAPAAMVLCAMGLGLIGWIKRRFA